MKADNLSFLEFIGPGKEPFVYRYIREIMIGKGCNVLHCLRILKRLQ